MTAGVFLAIINKLSRNRQLYDSLAQSVEHLTFNQGVRGSNPRWVTKQSLAFTPLSSVFARFSSFSKWQILTGFDDVKSVSVGGLLNLEFVKGHGNIYIRPKIPILHRS